ncbi:hypothetical protein ACFXPV_38705 [Streptomyces sp. NPDC059118]|uniref:hypothetical protein n=1 Tax=Streptomyces sp. NPDC059118 TaxID=3346731 RepID=UPI0036C4D919
MAAFRERPDPRFFGEQTLGVPTDSDAHRLSNDAMLILTEVKDAPARAAPTTRRFRRTRKSSRTPARWPAIRTPSWTQARAG